ncbi:RagB/SusD family nutrient uptake outer membrane protein [Paraflavitalea pollutisoli]|uniref:RagB/SusD family nutrient uptake outer membrane protein n=1 Tax=Paraflavitalea pollutisoli TaxID=3034143 RepID=UPI0023ED6E23|nr:RagB/SusD family nutrient uptake outer membrane protein [Paraflavitalea sp. H1-2-19X]
MLRSITSWLLCAMLIIFASCNKKEFLEQNPDSNIFIPTTLEDCQALLDNETVMNESPVLGEVAADNFFISTTFWNTLTPREKNAYIWHPNSFEGMVANVVDWNSPYKQVFYANVVLQAVESIEITSSNEVKWKEVKGQAFFARAHAFYQIAQLFAPVFSSKNPESIPGIVLRLQPEVDEISLRSSLEVTYRQIIHDLKEAARFLSNDIPLLNRNRSSKPAALGLLARTFLSMDDYNQALKYADSCLQLYPTLIKYDTLTIGPNSNQFNKFNPETIYQSRFVTTNVLRAISVSSCVVDSSLYRSYETNDLRKAVFFRVNSQNTINPKSSYNGTNQLFTGIATDEIYLIRAECNARLGNVSEAMEDLNTLLEHRWRISAFRPLTVHNDEEALDSILAHRRKELPFRGLRWTDLRRLNKNGANIILKRWINNKDYELRPGDLRYTFLIPPDVISFTGMQQNPR